MTRIAPLAASASSPAAGLWACAPEADFRAISMIGSLTRTPLIQIARPAKRAHLISSAGRAIIAPWDWEYTASVPARKVSFV